jgi:hypothetical protein
MTRAGSDRPLWPARRPKYSVRLIRGEKAAAGDLYTGPGIFQRRQGCQDVSFAGAVGIPPLSVTCLNKPIWRLDDFDLDAVPVAVIDGRNCGEAGPLVRIQPAEPIKSKFVR